MKQTKSKVKSNMRPITPKQGDGILKNLDEEEKELEKHYYQIYMDILEKEGGPRE